mmetsp:Transcript_12589/g.19155  ORF Transcript_12589/g.19155 Transcript_12589/m.19155 type:complete len:867 (-) Transcript_12589:550-3150(-)
MAGRYRAVGGLNQQNNPYQNDDLQRSYGSGPTGREWTGDEPTDEVESDPSKLYHLCEAAMPTTEESRSTYTPTAKELARRKETLDALWKALRMWFRTHANKQERAEAAQYQGTFASTALHLGCKLSDPPADVIAELVRCSPETVTWADSNGWLPLHHACANGASGEVLKILVDAFPESPVAQDSRQRTPLHFAFFRADVRSQDTHEEAGRSMAAIVSLLCESGAASLDDENGMLPLHYACAYGTSVAVLEVLIDAYPESVIARERMGRTPLHLTMVNAHRAASPRVLQYLLSLSEAASMINMTDREGNLPINLLANSAVRVGPEAKEGRTNATDCLKMYLDAKPRATVDVLTALQNLPEWLREKAVTSSHVQNILNDKIVKRFPTSILMLDGYMLLVIIVCFELSSSNHIDERFTGEEGENTFKYIIFILLGGSYFMIRELVQVISLWSLGAVQSWLFDTTNWLDMCLIVLVFYYGSAMINDDIGSDESFRSGVAFTKGILWCAVISFLKSTLVDFAVFVGGVFYVVQRLAAFLLALGVILLAFAQMFLIVYTETGICKLDGDEFPHCTFNLSLLKVYTMLMGEIGDETRYETSRVAQFLYVVFAFLVVILLSNVLIAIVTDSYGIIKNDRANIVFWSNRLDFVAEMDAIASVKNKFLAWGGFSDEKKNKRESQMQEGPNGDIIDADDDDKPKEKELFRAGWNNLMSLFDANLYDDIDITLWSLEFWCYFFFRILAVIFIIPCWIALGIFTAGWLWPPQVREWLFVQKHAVISRADLRNQVLMEMNNLREDIKTLKRELKAEMRNDRIELITMKAEVEDVQGDVMSDLLQVKELMTTLLEMTRAHALQLEERNNDKALMQFRDSNM